MSNPGEVITFYSYKGGTGRTMALANTGFDLARELDDNVLMVDWDLEAPGLQNFFPEVESRAKESQPMRGVLELFERANAFSHECTEIGQSHSRVFWEELELEQFIAPTDVPSLHLMCAGNLDASYGDRVSSLPWQDLFGRRPDLFKAFTDELASRYRYVLIDSRTGLTDSSGICTTLLPDRLVVVFTPNRQSLTGVVDLVRRATAYRGRSPDLRPLLVFPLASRVEMSEEDLRREWRYGKGNTLGYQPQFEQLFKDVYNLPDCSLERYFDEVQIQHATSYAYGERVAVRDERSDRLSLSRSYERFTRALLDAEGPWAFEREARAVPATEGRPDVILARLEKARMEHEFSARRARMLDTALLLGAFGVLVAGLVIYALLSVTSESSTPTFIPWIAGTIIVASVIAAIRWLWALRQHYVIHARTANALAREPTLFETGAGEYAEQEAPLALLAERLEQIELQAEDALLDPRDSLHLFRAGRSGGTK